MTAVGVRVNVHSTVRGCVLTERAFQVCLNHVPATGTCRRAARARPARGRRRGPKILGIVPPGGEVGRGRAGTVAVMAELGYLELDRRGAGLLFKAVTGQERNSAAIASNESFSGWAKTFTGPKGCPVIPDGRATTATAPRRVVGTPEYAQYADAPPPCDAPHLTPRAVPPGMTGQPLACAQRSLTASPSAATSSRPAPARHYTRRRLTVDDQLTAARCERETGRHVSNSPTIAGCQPTSMAALPGLAEVRASERAFVGACRW
jgi:hypothetical protein